MADGGPVRLFLAADRAVFRHIPAVLNSARAVTSRPLEVGVVVHRVAEPERAALAAKLPEVRFAFFESDQARLAGLKVKRNLSPLTFARLLMPDLVDWDRYVYLDVDLLILRDLGALQDTPLDGHPAAAVRSGGDGPINGGVLVVDAALWRARGLGAQMLDYARRHSPKEADQDSIEAVIGAEILPLDPRWNRLVDTVWGPPVADPEALLREAWILHFITGFKPWNLGCWRIPAPLTAAWARHADGRGLPRDWPAEARMLVWQLAMLAKERRPGWLGGAGKP